jgi:hypothetical protein
MAQMARSFAGFRRFSPHRPRTCLTLGPSWFCVMLSREHTHTHTHTHPTYTHTTHTQMRTHSFLLDTFALFQFLWIPCAHFLASLHSPSWVCVSAMCPLPFVSSQNRPFGGPLPPPSAVARMVAAASLVMEKNCLVGWENGQRQAGIMKLKVILPTGGHFSQLRGNSLPL